MRILFIGDVVGEPGRRALASLVPRIRKREGVGFVIANAENIAHGSGLMPQLADELLEAGVDCLTSGDHVWKRKEIYDRLATDSRIIRPANYPKEAVGYGSTVLQSESGTKVAVINLLGRVFMQAVECPFRVVKEEVAKMRGRANIIIVDIHAEATSEKIALGWFLDGEVSAVLGTHTHVQTADEKILPKGTAFISDVGMAGPYDSVLGRDKTAVISRFVTQMPVKFDTATGDIQMHGVIIDVDEKTGRAVSIKRIQEKYA